MFVFFTAEQEQCPTDGGSKTTSHPIYVNSLSTGAIVGIGIGCMVALVVLFLVSMHSEVLTQSSNEL